MINDVSTTMVTMNYLPFIKIIMEVSDEYLLIEEKFLKRKNFNFKG